MGAPFGHVVTTATRAKLRAALLGRPQTQEFRDRVSATLKRRSPRGPDHKWWKGGLWKHHSGYVYINCPGHPRADKDGYVKRSCLVMEKTIGRYLRPGEVVHHINGTKDDDRPENLMLFSDDAEHQRHHVKTGTHTFNRKKS